MSQASDDPLQTRPEAPASAASDEHPLTDATPRSTRAAWLARLWHALRRYPLPLVALALLLVSLGLWLGGRADLANWTFLTIIALGAVPLVWETLGQLVHKEFGSI